MTPLLLLLLLLLPLQSEAHVKTLIDCPKLFTFTQLVPLGVSVNYWKQSVEENYDTDGDGKANLAVVSHVVDMSMDREGEIVITHNPIPWMYLIDEDGDGLADRVYVDKAGEGKCEDIYERYNRSQSERKKEVS